MDCINLELLYDNMLITIAIVIVFFMIFMHIYVIPTISKICMYNPRRATIDEFYKLSKKYKRNEELIKFKATDKTKLTGMFINYHKKPDWNDTIFLYSHGNGAWLGELLYSPQIHVLSNFGSVFTYDYRQYGLSEGYINEEGTYSDIMGVWNYLTQVKKISPKKIIIYGHSMGGAVSTKLVSMLVEKKQELPLALILDGTFSSVIDMGNHMIPGFGQFASYTYDNVKNLQDIDNALPILVVHSPDDETVPYQQSIKIKQNSKCKHIEIKGTHNVPIFNKNVFEFIYQLTQEKYV